MHLRHKRGRMVRTPAAIVRQEERTSRRRGQILDAARICVRQDGFRGASMSRISAEASMSMGHIHRYFPTKQSILMALIERDIDDFRALITQIGDSPVPHLDALIESIVSNLPALLDDDRVALWVEVQAEAARNSKVEELLSAAYGRFRELMGQIMSNVVADMSEREIDTRVELLVVMTHALGVYAGTHHLPDYRRISDGVEIILRAILSPTRGAVKEIAQVGDGTAL